MAIVPIPVRPSVLERDVDQVLERRLSNDAGFAERFIGLVTAQVGRDLPFDGLGVDAQMPHAGVRGSIDLVARLWHRSGQETGRLLIENKLDSGFTPDQPERYASSASALSTGGRPAFAVLCAPEGYLSRSRHTSPFHARVSYEQIAGWLDGEDRSLLQAAIMRFQMPYEPDPVPAVGEFFDGYEQLAKQYAPDLVIKRNPNSAGARPEASRTIYFDTARSLPRYEFLPTLRFSHQCWDSGSASPSVKIMFADWAEHETCLRRIAMDDLANTRLYLRKAGRSLGLVHDTPRLDNKRPVSEQIQAVIAGLRGASTLRAWMFANSEVLAAWSGAVALVT